VIKKAAGDDPVVYTTLDGIDIRKSADPTLLALAKSNDDKARRLAKAEATSEDVDLTKRATDDLGNVGGDLVGKKALLKAVDGITDESTREAARAVLKAANESGKGAFIRKGSSGEGPAVETAEGGAYEMTEAEAKLEEMAKAHAKDNKVSFEKAYSEVIQTSEGSALYKRFTDGE
jgi:hypothetical protein